MAKKIEVPDLRPYSVEGLAQAFLLVDRPVLQQALSRAAELARAGHNGPEVDDDDDDDPPVGEQILDLLFELAAKRGAKRRR